jgi:hypothetical protein
MVSVRVTVAMGKKTVSIDEVRDQRIVTALRQASRDIGVKLSHVKCPVHGKAPTDIRLHFDAGYNADLKYESCCEKLGEAVGKAL